jgi:hypothetical protein
LYQFLNSGGVNIIIMDIKMKRKIHNINIKQQRETISWQRQSKKTRNLVNNMNKIHSVQYASKYLSSLRIETVFLVFDIISKHNNCGTPARSKKFGRGGSRIFARSEPSIFVYKEMEII